MTISTVQGEKGVKIDKREALLVPFLQAESTPSDGHGNQ